MKYSVSENYLYMTVNQYVTWTYMENIKILYITFKYIYRHGIYRTGKPPPADSSTNKHR